MAVVAEVPDGVPVAASFVYLVFYTDTCNAFFGVAYANAPAASYYDIRFVEPSTSGPYKADFPYVVPISTNDAFLKYARSAFPSGTHFFGVSLSSGAATRAQCRYAPYPRAGEYSGLRVEAVFARATISGTVNLSCVSGCSSAPEPFADVHVQATEGDDTYTGVTDDHGKYDIQVPSGHSYTVSSADDEIAFRPESKEVDVEGPGPYDGQDFDACTSAGTTGIDRQVQPAVVTDTLVGQNCHNKVSVGVDRSAKTMTIIWKAAVLTCRYPPLAQVVGNTDFAKSTGGWTTEAGPQTVPFTVVGGHFSADLKVRLHEPPSSDVYEHTPKYGTAVHVEIGTSGVAGTAILTPDYAPYVFPAEYLEATCQPFGENIELSGT